MQLEDRGALLQIAEMQLAREDNEKIRNSISSPPLGCREVPRKHYLKKELSIMSEDSVTWQTSEVRLISINFDGFN